MTYAYNQVEKYYVSAEAIAPLHIGSAVGDRSEVLMHPVKGEPFIQASSISGVLRSVCAALAGNECAEKLFGTSQGTEEAREAGSKVRISDGAFRQETVQMEFRPRVRIDAASGTVSNATLGGSGRTSGQKFEMELIGTGACFDFTVYLRHCKDDGFDTVLESVLAVLASGNIQIGGQRSNGCGFLKLVNLYRQTFSLTSEEGRKAWKREEEDDISTLKTMDGIRNLTEEWKKDAADHVSSVNAYEIYVTGRTEGSILVKGASVDGVGEGAPDAENMRNAGEHFIVPGSSLKGALKARIKKISSLLGKKSFIDECFGSTGKGDAMGSRGNILVWDTVIGERDQDVQDCLQHRIHIDKFTGGVFQRGLFSEKTVSGSLGMRVDISDRQNPDAAAGLCVLAFRDLASGLWNLGSGYSVGRGFIRVEKMVVSSLKDGKELIVDFTNKEVRDQDSLYAQLMTALEK